MTVHTYGRYRLWIHTHATYAFVFFIINTPYMTCYVCIWRDHYHICIYYTHAMLYYMNNVRLNVVRACVVMTEHACRSQSMHQLGHKRICPPSTSITYIPSSFTLISSIQNTEMQTPSKLQRIVLELGALQMCAHNKDMIPHSLW